MDSGSAPSSASRNDDLLQFHRSQKFGNHLPRRKTTYFMIVRIVLGCVRRAEYHKFISVRFDDYSQIVTVSGR
jgi:hypothetical protein